MMTHFMGPERRAAARSSTVSGHASATAIAALPPTNPQCRAPERQSEHVIILQKAVAILVIQMQILGVQSDMKKYLIDYARLYNHAQARVVDLMLTIENIGGSSVWLRLARAHVDWVGSVGYRDALHLCNF